LTGLPQGRPNRFAAYGVAHYVANFFVYISDGIHAGSVLPPCRRILLCCCGASICPCLGICRATSRIALSPQGCFSASVNVQHLDLTLQLSSADLTSHVAALEISLGNRHVSLKIGAAVLTNLAELLGIGLSSGRSTFTNCPKEVGVVGASNAKTSLKQRHVLRFSAAVAFVGTGIPYPV
jgi:hypothetical protein